MRKSFTSDTSISLNDFLRSELKKLPEFTEYDISNSKIRRMIVAGCVTVNGRGVTRPGFELRGKSTVVCDIDIEKFFFEKQPEDIDFILTEKDVLFEDDFIILVNKPAFLPVEQTIVGNRKNLHDAVVEYLWTKNHMLRNPPYVGIMHRLDRETSGVILFTKQRSANKSLFEQFEKHTITKTYIAVVSGNTTKKEFTVENTIGRISPKSQVAKWGSLPESRGGLYAKTSFKIMKTLKINKIELSTVHCELFTGRTHQIRVHLSESGLPILGDKLYGGKDFKRIMLHANMLEFTHPISGKKMCICAASKDFAEFV